MCKKEFRTPNTNKGFKDKDKSAQITHIGETCIDHNLFRIKTNKSNSFVNLSLVQKSENLRNSKMVQW